jgi:hypothetical protein
MADIAALHRFLRGEFEAEANTGFARLKRVPHTQIRHFLDYYLSLNPQDQDALADAATLMGTHWLAGPAATYGSIETNPAWTKWHHELIQGKARHRRYWASVPILRATLAQIKIDRARGKPSSFEEGIEQFATSVKGVTAPELRKHIARALASLLGAKPRNIGGEWRYAGLLNGSLVTVQIDYGGSLAQLRYQVTVTAGEPPLALRRLAFESLFGIARGDWDFIVEEDLADAVALLCECVGYLSTLPHRLPQGSLPADASHAPSQGSGAIP